MTNKEDNRPAKGGKNRVVIQQVYIGFVGIKCCGKPVCVECGVKLSDGQKVPDPDNLPLMSCCSGCGGA